MNRKITFIVLSLLIGQLAFAQNCKYKTNELDKTTNKMVKETKSKVVWEKPFDSQGKMTAKKVGDDFFLTFVYDRGLGGAEFVVNKGNELIFVLENGTEVKLQRVPFPKNSTAGSATIAGENDPVDTGMISSLSFTDFLNSVFVQEWESPPYLWYDTAETLKANPMRKANRINGRCFFIKF